VFVNTKVSGIVENIENVGQKLLLEGGLTLAKKK
jgi:hypothetical protein